ncbi:MAG: hypothetical protein HY055_09255 [Magnetospirillum sp.]|nr:hypothetical protein [Magnetospirillum sp.]
MVAKRRIATIDAATGEILEGVVVHLPVRRASPYGQSWLQLHQDPLIQLARDPRVTVQTYRVLMVVLRHLAYDNLCPCPPSQVGRLLGMTTANASRQLAKLADLGILISGPRIGNSPTYQLHPYWGWRGKVARLREVLTPTDAAEAAAKLLPNRDIEARPQSPVSSRTPTGDVVCTDNTDVRADNISPSMEEA